MRKAEFLIEYNSDHIFCNTDSEFRFCKGKLIAQLLFFVDRGGNLGGKIQHWIQIEKHCILSKFG